MSTRDIQDQLKDLYGVDISSSLISTVTESVIEEVKSWQSRSLDLVYPIVYLDALVIKVKENKQIINKSFYLALGINLEGQKELLGMWVSQLSKNKDTTVHCSLNSKFAKICSLERQKNGCL